MSLKEHKKHTALSRPALGNFGRNEYSLLGAPCGIIKQLADKVIASLSPVYRIAYVDAQHSDEGTLMPGRLAAGAATEFTGQDNCQQISLAGEISQFRYRTLFADCDMILVNGNHHRTKKQIVIIDPAKKASLQKRVGQLTDVVLFVLSGDVTEIFDFLKEEVDYWQQIPVCHLDETDKIISFFETQLTLTQPKLNGLVLAGGKSVRMGFDKGALNWHGKPQRNYMADVLKNYCDEVFLSVRADQQPEIGGDLPTIADTFTGLGPYGAILSAFREQPDSAWLVVACDLPLLNAETLQYLISERKLSAVATTFESPFDGFPEPLITIWEPKSYALLLSFLAQGYSCPRKVLINSDTHILQVPDTAVLTNVNTPEEMEHAKQVIAQKTITA